MSGDTPSPPDPYAVSAAQTQSNVATAQEQAKLGMTSQTTPYGSIQYVVDATSPSGYRAVTTLSPEMQALTGQGQSVEAAALGNVGNTISQPFDLSAAAGSNISDMQRTFLDPQWQQQQSQLETQMANQGIQPGSQAYQLAMTQFNNQKDNAYNSMYLNAYQTANQDALTQRNIPLTDYQTLSGVANEQSPQLQTTPSPGVAATDVSGNVNSAYQQQVAQSNAAMGGLFGLGSAALGGWAQSGGLGTAATALMAMSDVRSKTDIVKIGEDPRGWNVYQFRYKGAEKTPDTWQVGYMAQEVEKHRPDAVITSPSTGIKFVDYGRLAA